MTEHTPLPWAFSPWHIEEGPSAVRAPAGNLVTTTASDADAAYIIKACNAFPDLVKALESAREAVEYSVEVHGTDHGGMMLSALNQIDRALAAVKGGKDHG